jgi:rod shape-determining protein MreC
MNMKNNRKNRRNPRYVLLLLGAFCIAGIGISVFKGYSASTGRGIISSLLAPMQEGINSIGNFTSGIAEKKHNIETLESENEDLNNQIDMLQSKLTAMENNLSEYEELLELLELSEQYPTYEMTGARIISKDPGNWYDTFIINKGSLDGIEADMNVIADNGLVGIVTKVNPTSAVVRSIIDDTSNVSGMISKNRDVCIVNGDLTLIDSGLLNVELISKDSTVVDGDEVVTSYISDKYLPGILIGYISEVTMDESELTYNAKLTPAVDFEHLSSVLVIKQLKSEITSTETKSETEVETEVETDYGGEQEES